MPRYYCDYCDNYLTHDSPSVRKQHNAGFKHKANVRAYFLQFEQQQTEDILEKKMAANIAMMNSMSGPGFGGPVALPPAGFRPPAGLQPPGGPPAAGMPPGGPPAMMRPPPGPGMQRPAPGPGPGMYPPRQGGHPGHY